MDKIYTIIGGINGVGKSSFIGARDIKKRIDVDKMAKDKGISNIEAGRLAIVQIDEFLEQGESFAQETTLSGRRILKTIEKAKARGYRIELYYIGIDTVEESLARIRNRVSKGGHDIPEGDVRRRYEERFLLLKEVLKLCDEVMFVDNYNGFVGIAILDNEGLWIGSKERKPKWFEDLREEVGI